MGLSIKNERVHELARQAAAATGKTQTGAIEEALTRLLADYDIDPQERRLAAKVNRVHSIVRAYLDTPPVADREITTVDDLYAEQSGLPRWSSTPRRSSRFRMSPAPTSWCALP